MIWRDEVDLLSGSHQPRPDYRRGRIGRGTSARAARSLRVDESWWSERRIRFQVLNAPCTPHLGYAERDGYEALYRVAVDQLLAYAEGQSINVANPEVVGKP